MKRASTVESDADTKSRKLAKVNSRVSRVSSMENLNRNKSNDLDERRNGGDTRTNKHRKSKDAMGQRPSVGHREENDREDRKEKEASEDDK